jgi:hypothetical protein
MRHNNSSQEGGMKASINLYGQATAILSDEHSACSHGRPVLVYRGQPHGLGDMITLPDGAVAIVRDAIWTATMERAPRREDVARWAGVLRPEEPRAPVAEGDDIFAPWAIQDEGGR